MISVLCNRTENDGVGAEEIDGLTVVELEGERQESNERRQLHISPETFKKKNPENSETQKLCSSRFPGTEQAIYEGEIFPSLMGF